MTRSELISKWCDDLKQEKADEFDADLSSMLDDMITSYNKTISNLISENNDLKKLIWGDLLNVRPINYTHVVCL